MSRQTGSEAARLNVEATLSRAQFATKLELEAASGKIEKTREAGLGPAEPIVLPAARDVDVATRRKALKITKESTDRVITSFNEAADIARRIAVDRAAAVVELKQDLERISADLKRDAAVREKRTAAAAATTAPGSKAPRTRTATVPSDDIEGGAYDDEDETTAAAAGAAETATTAAILSQKRPAHGTRATSGVLLASGVGRGTGKGTDGREHVKGTYFAGEFGTPRNDGASPNPFSPPVEPAIATKKIVAAITTEASLAESFRDFAGLARPDFPRGGSPSHSPSRIAKEQDRELFIQQRTVGNAPRLNNASGRYSASVTVHPSLGTTIAPSGLGSAAGDGKVARSRPDVMARLSQLGTNSQAEPIPVLLPKKSRAALQAEAAAIQRQQRAVEQLKGGVAAPGEAIGDGAAEADVEGQGQNQNQLENEGLEHQADEEDEGAMRASGTGPGLGATVDSLGRPALPGRAAGALAPKLRQQPSMRGQAIRVASNAAKDKETIKTLQEATKPGIAKGARLLPEPSELVFQDFKPGQPFALTLKITNIGLGFNQFDLLELPDSVRDIFAVSFIPPGRMSPGVSVPITITFLPRTNEDLDSTLTLRTPTGLLAVPLRCRIKRAVPKAVLFDENGYQLSPAPHTAGTGAADSDEAAAATGDQENEKDARQQEQGLLSLEEVSAASSSSSTAAVHQRLTADFGNDGFYPNGSAKRCFTLRLTNVGALPIVATVRRTGLLAPDSASVPAGAPLASSPFYLLQSPVIVGPPGTATASPTLLTDPQQVTHRSLPHASLGHLESEDKKHDGTSSSLSSSIGSSSFLVKGHSTLSLSLVCVSKDAGEGRETFEVACFEGKEGLEASLQTDYRYQDYACYRTGDAASTTAASSLRLLRVFALECRVGVKDCPVYIPSPLVHFGSVFAGELYVASLLVRNRAVSTFSALVSAGKLLQVKDKDKRKDEADNAALASASAPAAAFAGLESARAGEDSKAGHGNDEKALPLARVDAGSDEEDEESNDDDDVEIELASSTAGEGGGEVGASSCLSIEPSSAYIPPKEKLLLPSSSASSPRSSQQQFGSDEVEGICCLTLKLRIPVSRLPLPPADAPAAAAETHVRIPCKIKATGGGSNNRCTFVLPFTIEAIVVRPSLTVRFADGLGFDTPSGVTALRKKTAEAQGKGQGKGKEEKNAKQKKGKTAYGSQENGDHEAEGADGKPVIIHPRPSSSAPSSLLRFGDVPSGKCIRRTIAITSNSPLPTLFTVSTAPPNHPPKHELGLLATAGLAATSAVWVVEAPQGQEQQQEDDGQERATGGDPLGLVPFASTSAVPLQALHLKPYETRTLYLLFRPLCPGGVSGLVEFRCLNGIEGEASSNNGTSSSVVGIRWQGAGVAPHLLSSVTRLLLPPLTGDDTAVATVLLKNVLPSVDSDSSSPPVVHWRMRATADDAISTSPDHPYPHRSQYRFTMAPLSGLLGPGGEARVIVTATLNSEAGAAKKDKKASEPLFLQQDEEGEQKADPSAVLSHLTERFLCGLEVFSSVQSNRVSSSKGTEGAVTATAMELAEEATAGEGKDQEEPDEFAMLGTGALQSLLSPSDKAEVGGYGEATVKTGKSATATSAPEFRPQRLFISVLASPHPTRFTSALASKDGKKAKAAAAAQAPAEGEKKEAEAAGEAKAAEEEEEDTYNGAFFSCQPVGRLGFGGVNVGGASSRELAVTNNSRTIPLRVTVASADPSASSAFTLPVPTLLLQPLSKGAFPITFSPAEGRRYAGALRITAVPEASDTATNNNNNNNNNSNNNNNKASSTAATTLAGVQRLLHVTGEGLLPTISFQRLTDCLADVISAAAAAAAAASTSSAGVAIAPEGLEQAHVLALAAKRLGEGMVIASRDGTVMPPVSSSSSALVVKSASATGGTDQGQRLKVDFGLLVAGDGAYRCCILANDSPFPVPFAVRRLPDNHAAVGARDPWTIPDGGPGGLVRAANGLSGYLPSSSTQWMESESAAEGAGAGLFSVEPREGLVHPGQRLVLKLSADTRSQSLRSRLLAATSRSCVALRSSASFLLEVVTSTALGPSSAVPATLVSSNGAASGSDKQPMSLRPLLIKMETLLSDRRTAILPPPSVDTNIPSSNSNTAIRLRLPGGSNAVRGKDVGHQARVSHGSLLYPSLSLSSPLLISSFLGSKVSSSLVVGGGGGPFSAGLLPLGRGDGAFPFGTTTGGGGAKGGRADPAATLGSLLFSNSPPPPAATHAASSPAQAETPSSLFSTSSSASGGIGNALRSLPVVLPGQLLEVTMNRPPTEGDSSAVAQPPPPAPIQLSLACADRLGHRLSLISSDLLAKASGALLPALASATKVLSAAPAPAAAAPPSANPGGKADPKAAAKPDPKAAAAAAPPIPAPVDPATLLPSVLFDLDTSPASQAQQASAALFVFPQTAPIEDDQALAAELLKPLPVAETPAASAAPADPKAKPADPKAAAAAGAPAAAAAAPVSPSADPSAAWQNTVLGALLRGDTTALSALAGGTGASTSSSTSASASALLKASGITNWVSVLAEPLGPASLPGSVPTPSLPSTEAGAAPPSASVTAGKPDPKAAAAAKPDPKAAAAAPAAAIPAPAAGTVASSSFAAVVRDTVKPGTGLCVRFSVPPSSIAPQALTPLALSFLNQIHPRIPGPGNAAIVEEDKKVLVSEGARKCYGLLVLAPTEIPPAAAFAPNPAELATAPPPSAAPADPKAKPDPKAAAAAAAAAPPPEAAKKEEPPSTALALSLTACPKVIRLCFSVPPPA